ncbi:MAG: S1C family serine protease [Thermoguttaceae bacterium]
MTKISSTYVFSLLISFVVALSSLFWFFPIETDILAQTLPFMKQHVKGEGPQSTGSSLPIPEMASTLPRPIESPLYIERYPELIPEERISVQIYEQCNRSVVNIDTRTTYNHIFFGEEDIPGAGSGVVLDRDGHILTNSHVINKVDAVTVTLASGESYPATIVGEDPITDLAVLQITAPADELFPVQLADSSRLLVGQKVFAIGNPFGLERTLTSGIISSLNRAIPGRFEARSIKGAIQIDAAINPGNSGGSLLDTQGKMIGLNTAIASKSGGSHGVGFAIPSNTISRIAPQLINSGKVIRGDVGIMRIREIERQSARGLLIISLVPKGAAEKAGLRGPRVVKERSLLRGTIVIEQPKIDLAAADVIIGVNGIETKKADDFTAIIDERKPGEQVVLDVLREGNRIKIPVILE